MARIVYIDLSAKLEQWTADTVIAMANGGETVLISPANVGREQAYGLVERARSSPATRYSLRVPATGWACRPDSRAKIETIDAIVIDDDYPGETPAAAIKNELVPL